MASETAKIGSSTLLSFWNGIKSAAAWVGRAAVSVPGWGATTIWGSMNVIASLALSIWAAKYFYGFKFASLVGMGHAVDNAVDVMSASPNVRWIAIGYLLVQGLSLVSMNISNVFVLWVDIFTSLIPAGVIGLAAADHLRHSVSINLSAARVEDLWFMLAVVAIDVGVYGVVGLKLNRRYLGDVMGGNAAHG